MRIVTGVGDLVQRIGDNRTGRVLGGRAIDKFGGAVCGLHRARGDEERGFLGLALKPMSTVCEWFDLKTTRTVSHRFGPQNQWRRFVSGLVSKPLERFLTGLASKPVATVSGGLTSKLATTVSSGFTLKSAATIFSSLTSKLVMTFSLGLTSKSVISFLVEPQNQGGSGLPGLCLQTSSSSLMNWVSKSPQWFLGLILKIK
jgi:hypothetical protein